MAWWMVAGAVGGMQVAGGILGNREARKAGRENVRLMRMEADEHLRRMGRQFKYQLGEAATTYAARGLTAQGSTGRVLNEMTTEYERQRDWFKRTAEQQQRIARRSGRYVGVQQIIQGIGAIGAAGIGARDVNAPTPGLGGIE